MAIFSTVTPEDVLAYVNANEAELPFVTTCLATATALVDNYVGDTEGIPTVIFDRALTQVAADLFNQKKAPNGVITQAYSGDIVAEPIRVARDPLVSAYKTLGRWVSPW